MRGGDPNRGKCTIEVVVDGAAEVEVRGDMARLRNLAGQPAQWRRFECNAPMPANPMNFRFAGIDGRGRQDLVRDPRNSGGFAVVRIEDPKSGSEGYTFDLMWNGSAGYPPQGGPAYAPAQDRGYDRGYDERDQDIYHRDRDDWFRGQSWRERFFWRIREDVEHVQSVAFPFGGDQYRLARTKQELDELQEKLAAGRYDEGELDDVIAAMQAVLRDNRLLPRDRDILTDDLNRMRDFRARHDYYGARDYGVWDQDVYHRDRDEWFQGEGWRWQLFRRVREDLEHAQSVTPPFSGDQRRLSRTREELDELQNKLAAGRYDQRELDDVIAALQTVVRDNRLTPRDRDILSDDLNRLRDFRARHEYYGAR